MLPVSEWAKTIATRDSWSSSLQKHKHQEQSQILSTCHFQLGVMCLHWVEKWLCCEPWVLPVCYISCPHKNAHCISGLLHLRITDTVLIALVRLSYGGWVLFSPLRGPIAGSYRRTCACCEEDLLVSQTQHSFSFTYDTGIHMLKNNVLKYIRTVWNKFYKHHRFISTIVTMLQTQIVAQSCVVAQKVLHTTKSPRTKVNKFLTFMSITKFKIADKHLPQY